jgi:hypothetical protein
MARFFLLIVCAVFFLNAPLAYADDPAPEPAPITDEAAEAAYREAVEEQRIQTEIPEPEAPKDQKIRDFEPFIPPAWLTELARYLMYGSLALLAALIIFKLADAWRHGPNSQRLEAGQEAAPDEAAELVAARMDQTHLEAEELAARGLFGAAMHLLLLRSLSEMRLRLGISLAVSLTSREIVGRVKLGDLTRAALADLVRRVEVTYFGEQAASESEYLASRHSFEVLTGNLRAGGLS